MLIFDVFYYSTYMFCIKVLRKCKDDAKSTSLINLVIFTTFFIDVLAYCVGMVRDNAVSSFLLHKAFLSYIFIGIILFAIFGLRYYKLYDVNHIEQRLFDNNININFKLFKFLHLLVMIVIFILGFITFRLYMFGHIKWW